MKYTEAQIKAWKTKAEKWDNLGSRIEKCYMKENPNYNPEIDNEFDEFIENDDPDIDLGTIGELAAVAYGWL